MGAALVAAMALGGCERLMRDMYDQPKRGPGQGSVLFDDGRATRSPPPGSVARSVGPQAAISSGRHGAQALADAQAAETQQALPRPPGRALLARGQERYTIYCQPCHSPLGDGEGPVVRHGFPAPPSYHIERLRMAPDRHFYDVITHGHGVMYAYAGRVAPADRWAIVAYVRALQLSQHALLAQLPQKLRATLPAPPAPAAAFDGAAARAAPPAGRAAAETTAGHDTTAAPDTAAASDTTAASGTAAASGTTAAPGTTARQDTTAATGAPGASSGSALRSRSASPAAPAARPAASAAAGGPS